MYPLSPGSNEAGIGGHEAHTSLRECRKEQFSCGMLRFSSLETPLGGCLEPRQGVHKSVIYSDANISSPKIKNMVLYGKTRTHHRTTPHQITLGPGSTEELLCALASWFHIGKCRFCLHRNFARL